MESEVIIILESMTYAVSTLCFINMSANNLEIFGVIQLNLIVFSFVIALLANIG